MADEEKKEESSIGNTLKESLNTLKHNKKLDELYNFSKNNTRDTVALLILFIGILLAFFQPTVGSVLIGLIIGIYFANEITKTVNSIENIITNQGMIRSLILGLFALSLLVYVPYIVIGTALGVGLHVLLIPSSKNKD